MQRWIVTVVVLALALAVGLGASQEAQKKGGGKKAAAAKAAGPSAFLTEAAQGGLAEVELGKLAADKATNDEVKKFGQRMVDDHGKANDELKTLAQQKNVTLPTDLAPAAKRAKDHLSGLSGAAFDKAYMTHMVQDHTKDVAAFRREAKTATDPDVKAWAAKTLPTLEDHLKQAKDIDARVKGAGPAAKTGKGKGK